MKNQYILILIVIFSIILSGCEDFLDEAPVTTLSTRNFFETQKDLEQAVNAAYSSLRSLSGNGTDVNGGYWVFSELRSDNTTFMYNPVDRSGHPFWYLDNFIMDAQSGLVVNFWRDSYAGIAKCNSVIEYSEGMEFENKARFIGEAKFLRALYYSYLVRYFGEVPLVSVSAESYEAAFANNIRVSKDKIYELILSDLDYAKNNLPEKYNADQAGRATSGAAKTLLAKEYMWLGRYNDAISELESVKNSGQYKLLTDNYASVFDVSNSNNQEIIFAVQFIEGTFNLHSTFMYQFAPWNAPRTLLGHAQVLARTGMNIPTTDLINAFESGDKRLSLIDTTYIDYVYGIYKDSIVPYTKKFWHEKHTVARQTSADFPLFRYPHVLLMLAECYIRESKGNPLPLVNEVRTRAGLTPLSNVTINDVIHERRVEFCCEADRWDVLVRTGLANEVMLAHGKIQRETRPPDVVGDDAYREIKLLFPIPSEEIETDPTLNQNPGWN